ncbi:MAG: hypothetical protein ABEK59_11200 [Halobacteria archaeon]
MVKASKVVISYPSDLSGWSRQQVKTRWFKGYLRKKLGDKEEGYSWDEFVDVGCCGSSHDVPLRIEGILDGEDVGEDTEIEYTTRESCGVECGWQAQSEKGPRSKVEDGS